MQSGDQAALRAASEAVWRSSSAELPPGENRALLAQNYAILVMFDDPAAAVPVFEDVASLAKQGFGTGNMSVETARFLRDFSRSQAKPSHKNRARAAAKSAVKLPEQDLAINQVILALQLLAGRNIELGQADMVAEYLLPLGEHLLTLDAVETKTIQDVEILRMVAVLNDMPDYDVVISKVDVTRGQQDFIDQLKASMLHFRMLQNRYPVQESIDAFDPDLAAAIAWEMLAESYFRSWEIDQRAVLYEESMPSQDPLFERRLDCGDYEWTSNRYTFPATENRQNNAVIIGFDFDDEGRVVGEKILAEVPDRRFGDHLVKQVGKFKADVSGLHEKCSKNHIFPVQYYIVAPR